jgi:hypothetical protein
MNSGITWLINIGMLAAVTVGLLVGARIRRRVGTSPRALRKVQRTNLWLMVPMCCAFAGFAVVHHLWISAGVMFLSTGVSLWEAFREQRKSEEVQNWAADPGHCGRCEYNLTANVSGRCPECGWEIPKKPPANVEKTWWKGWRIGYLEDWRKNAAVLTIATGALVGVAVDQVYAGFGSAWGINALLAVFMCVNLIRVLQYGWEHRGAGERSLK